MKYGVAVFLNIDNVYTYSHGEPIDMGQIVVVPVRNTEVIGTVVQIDNQSSEHELSNPEGTTKPIKSIRSILPYSIPEPYVVFAQFVADYNLNAVGMVLKLIVPFSIDALLSHEKIAGELKESKKTRDAHTTEVKLNIPQQNAVEKIIQLSSDGFKTFLLHGITGSGKTEVFLEVARNRLFVSRAERQILILVPEVALSGELAKKVAARIGIEVFIWHNSISKSKKLRIWRMAISGEPIAVVGARSALFIPFQNLGIIIVDEEHDSSFKQDETTMYNARDMAVYLGQCLKIPVILSSATPSVESYNNAKIGKYEYIKLSSRYFENAKLPEVTIHDLRKEKLNGCLSNYAAEKIFECLRAKRQALVFVNRRGHTPKVLCKSCGWKITCPGCSTWLCYHQDTSDFVCHCCGHRTYVRNSCEECGSTNLIGIGIGVEKAHEECKKLFPEARILVLSSDTMNTPNKIAKAIEEITRMNVDIILGTQIVAKGHNFDALNLVVVTCIDAMLYGEDFRSLERACQLLYQVSGRAGRTGEFGSEVIIQTFCPNDDLMKIVKNNDTERMYASEIRNRQLLKMPPFWNMASITMSALTEKEVSDFARELALKAPRRRDVKIIGPLQPVIFKMRSRYRLRLIVTSSSRLQDYIREWVSSIRIPKCIKIIIDIDPYNFN
ncbi:MAG: primosomal protein N' [Holosporales bacterium]|nr:primosomal protein N' [Holosporales bacterium]